MEWKTETCILGAFIKSNFFGWHAGILLHWCHHLIKWSDLDWEK